jgi:hypothetical protein
MTKLDFSNIHYNFLKRVRNRGYSWKECANLFKIAFGIEYSHAWLAKLFREYEKE